MTANVCIFQDKRKFFESVVANLEQRMYSMEEYLESGVQSSHKREFLARKILEVSGGTPNHHILAANMIV